METIRICGQDYTLFTDNDEIVIKINDESKTNEDVAIEIQKIIDDLQLFNSRFYLNNSESSKQALK